MTQSASEYKHNFMRSIIYEAIARNLPTMGRDFDVKVDFNDKDQAAIDIVGLTVLGQAIRTPMLLTLRSTLKTVQKEKEEQYGKPTTRTKTSGADESGTSAASSHDT